MHTFLFYFGSSVDVGGAFSDFLLGVGKPSKKFRDFTIGLITALVTGFAASFLIDQSQVFVALPLANKPLRTTFIVEVVATAFVAYSARIANDHTKRPAQAAIQHSVLASAVTVISRPFTSGGAHLNTVYNLSCIGLLFGYDVAQVLIKNPEIISYESVVGLVTHNKHIQSLLVLFVANLTGQFIAALLADYDWLLKTDALKNFEDFAAEMQATPTIPTAAPLVVK